MDIKCLEYFLSHSYHLIVDSYYILVITIINTIIP
jgi:hypothetical protein